MIRKTKRQKTTRVAREKVSALRRESAETKLRVSILKNDAHVESLIRELGELIEDAQRQVAVTTNAALTTLYWQVGRRVVSRSPGPQSRPDKSVQTGVVSGRAGDAPPPASVPKTDAR